MRPAILASLAAMVLTALPAYADDAIPGKIVLARASGSAIIIYDATSEVASVVHDKVVDAQANDRLERDAFRVLAQEAPNLSAASSVTVRVTYAETGDVSPVYGSPTFAGIERYAVLTCSGADVKSDRDAFKEKAATAAFPGWLKFEVVGKLPPR